MRNWRQALTGAVFAFGFMAATASAQPYELKAGRSTLVIDKDRNAVTFSEEGGARRITCPVGGLLNLRLQNPETHGSLEVSLPAQCAITPSNGCLWVRAERFQAGGQNLAIQAALVLAAVGEGIEVSGTVEVASAPWQIEEARVLKDAAITVAAREPVIYWPHDLGLRFTNPQEFGSRSFEYPGSRASMAWFALGDERGGLYLGSHDPERGAKKFSLAHTAALPGFTFSFSAPVYDRTFVLPKLVIRNYAGTWHEAARIYRGWFDQAFKRAQAPAWLRDNEGFMLTIFKQQNGDLMWKYDELDKLCDLGEKLNFRLIGVWGWGVGGHDRLYPNWSPDNLMGGRVELKQAIQRAQKRGFKVIVYSNGTLIDTATDYYAFNGLDTMLQEASGKPMLDFYVKYNNATPVIFTRACPGSSVWRNTILNTALAARELGLDAFYIDQVGVRGPDFCYSTRHDHAHPQESHTKWRVAMMKQVRDRLRQGDPDFCLITEGTTDSLLEDVDAYHSMWNGGPWTPNGRARPATHFPELYRYTFPETVIIYLNSQPVLPRWDANYAVVYGLRHEIMSRYPADADLLKHGKAPLAQDYSTINYPPDVRLINEVPAEKAIEYVRKITAWRTANADLMLRGKFVDVEGITAAGEDVLARAFVNGNQLGVVVWNLNTQAKREFTVQVPGYRLAKASAPGEEAVPAWSPLEPNSVRLLVFER